MNSMSQKKHPLRWFLLVWLGLVYIQGVLDGGSAPRLPTGARIQTGIDPAQFALVSFTLLMVLHCMLHWGALFREVRQRFLLPYFLAQAFLLLMILYIADAQSAIFGLCLALILEAIHMLKWNHLLVAVVGGYLAFYVLALNPVNYFANGDPQILTHKLISSVTLIMFVIGYVILYRLQAQAHKRDQELLHELEATHMQLGKTHAQLEAAHIQLEDYAAQVEDLTLVAERQRLARELHDTLAQGLVALTMQLETVDSLLVKQRSDQAREIVQQAMARARATMADARSAIDNLRAGAVPACDLSHAIQEAVQRFTIATGIPCTTDIAVLLSLPAAFYEHILRLVTEGLTNIGRHAQATQAWVRVVEKDGLLTLEVGDNGTGFDATALTQQNGHYGLLGLRERARLIGGQLDIVSAPGAGTIICLRLSTSDRGKMV